MNWLIIEDALKNRKGHWLAYLTSFASDLDRIGDRRRILCDRTASQEIILQLAAEPILPESIWHRMGDGAGPLKRLARIPLHAWATLVAVRKALKLESPPPDIIYIPTVLPHHLLAYTWLALRNGFSKKTVVLLYFLECPIAPDPATGKSVFTGGPSAKLMRVLLNLLKNRVESGSIVLGCETRPLRDALTEASGVKFTYLPQPVQPVQPVHEPIGPIMDEHGSILMSCFGPARHEKGSDILQSAILRYLQLNPDTTLRFAVHWVEDFYDPEGKLVSRLEDLQQHPKFTYLSERMDEITYNKWLLRTDVMLLPYRACSYTLRGSRVLIEALVNGIPVIVTKGTALSEQASHHGAAVECEDGSATSLGEAIQTTVATIDELRDLAYKRKFNACEHFSMISFRNALTKATHASPKLDKLR